MIGWDHEDAWGKCSVCGDPEDGFCVTTDRDGEYVRVCEKCSTDTLSGMLSGYVVGSAYRGGYRRDGDVYGAAELALHRFTAEFWRTFAVNMSWSNDRSRDKEKAEPPRGAGGDDGR